MNTFKFKLFNQLTLIILILLLGIQNDAFAVPQSKKCEILSSQIIQSKKMNKENSSKYRSWTDYLKSLFISKDTIPDHVPLVNLTANEIKNLRDELLIQLVADQLIDDNYAVVKMEVPPGKILVNDQELETALYAKYSSILDGYKVYPGVNRQIRIDEEATEVGDFINNSVRGSWLTYSDDLIEVKEKEEKKEKEPAFKNQGTVDLSVNELTSLRETLLIQLVTDRLIKNKRSKVKMEIPDGKIVLNGEVLNSALYAKYTGILEQYNIYPGLTRQVRIDSEITEVGDFTNNTVKGSWVKVK